jgi:hypothetical protein
VIDLTGSDSDVDVGNVAPPPMPVDNVGNVAPPPMPVDNADQFNETICPVHAQNLKTMKAYFEYFPDLAACFRPHQHRYAEGTRHCANCFEPVPAFRCGVDGSLVHHEWVSPDTNASRFEVNSETCHDIINVAEHTWRHEHSPGQTGQSGPLRRVVPIRGGMNNGVRTVYHGCGDVMAVSSIVTGGFVLPGGVLPDGTTVQSRNCAGREARVVSTTPISEYAFQKTYSEVGPAPPAPDHTPMSACLVIEAVQIIGSYSIGAATLAHSNGRSYGLSAADAVEFRSDRPELIIPVAILVRTFPTHADPLFTRYNHGS